MDIYLDNITVSAYCRVSTDTSDQKNSLENQVNYFSEYIKRNGNWTLGEIYSDEGISGTSIKKRDGFNRMIQDAIAGKFRLIITKEVSRFARNTVDTLTYTRVLKERGVGVYFVTDNINTLDKDGELRLTIMASLAQEESRKTSERVKWGQSRRMEQGVVFGRDLLGYSVKNGSLAVNEEEAGTVRLIFHKYVNEGKGTFTIARELTESGIKPKRVSSWSNTVILKILRNEKYAGDLLQKKTYTPDFLTHGKKYNRGQENKIYLRGHHEPIIDRNTWDRTQDELLRRSPDKAQKSKHSNRYWCSGKLICAECGGRFVSRTKRLKGGGKYKAWRCFAAANHGAQKTDALGNLTGCGNPSVNDTVLLSCVGQAIKIAQADKKTILTEITAEIKEVMSSVKPVETKALQKNPDKLYEKKNRAIDLFLEGLITRDDLKRQLESYDGELERLSKQPADVQSANRPHGTQAGSIRAIIAEINKILDFGTENEHLYREHLDKILIHPDKSLTVFLKHLTYGIKLAYKTVGRGGTFGVRIEHITPKINP